MSKEEVDRLLPKTVRQTVSAVKTKVAIPEAIKAIMDNLKECKIDAIPSITPPIINGTGDEEEAVLVLSDWQLGHKTRTFNAEVAKKRIGAIYKALYKVVELHRKAYPVKKLNLLLAGDFVQSEDVGYRVDLSELESILIDQVFEMAVPLLSWFIAQCAGEFEEVNVYCVRGNHGRGTKLNSEKTNWDDVIYKVLETKFEQVKHVHFVVAREFYQIININGTKVLLAHGDQVRGGSYGIPLYALLQRMLRWGTAMPEKWDILVVGHWHCYGHVEQNGQEVLVNGTLVSDDEFVRRNYGWNSSTLQVLFGIHPTRKLTWMYRLHP
jgi:predicted phosphodiesterase